MARTTRPRKNVDYTGQADSANTPAWLKTKARRHDDDAPLKESNGNKQPAKGGRKRPAPAAEPTPPPPPRSAPAAKKARATTPATPAEPSPSPEVRRAAPRRSADDEGGDGPYEALHAAYETLRAKYDEVKRARLDEVERLLEEQRRHMAAHKEAVAAVSGQCEAEAAAARRALESSGVAALQDDVRRLIAENAEIRTRLVEAEGAAEEAASARDDTAARLAAMEAEARAAPAEALTPSEEALFFLTGLKCEAATDVPAGRQWRLVHPATGFAFELTKGAGEVEYALVSAGKAAKRLPDYLLDEGGIEFEHAQVPELIRAISRALYA